MKLHIDIVQFMCSVCVYIFVSMLPFICNCIQYYNIMLLTIVFIHFMNLMS